MKFVIYNYSSEINTEPYYFNAGINLIEGHKSVLWNRNEHSLYDIFDYVKPDIFICDATQIPQELPVYVGENGGPEVVINITKLTHEQTSKIESFLKEKNVKVPFFFTNGHEKVQDFKTKIVNISCGADIFLSTDKQIEYNIDTCYLVDNKSQIVDIENKAYHYICNAKNANIGEDASVPIFNMGSLYKNYTNIVLKYYSKLLPQAFFDSVYYSNNVAYELEDKEKQNGVESLIRKVLKIESEELNFDEIKSKVQTKHTWLNRIKSLLSQFPDQQGLNSIDLVIEKYRKAKQ